MTPASIRAWYAALLQTAKPGASTAAKSYRLLRTILKTAVEDELLPRNPRLITGAGLERPDERPAATIEQVYALADAIEPCFRAMVLTATLHGPAPRRTARAATGPPRPAARRGARR